MSMVMKLPMLDVHGECEAEGFYFKNRVISKVTGRYEEVFTKGLWEIRTLRPNYLYQLCYEDTPLMSFDSILGLRAYFYTAEVNVRYKPNEALLLKLGFEFCRYAFKEEYYNSELRRPLVKGDVMVHTLYPYPIFIKEIKIGYYKTAHWFEEIMDCVALNIDFEKRYESR